MLPQAVNFTSYCLIRRTLSKCIQTNFLVEGCCRLNSNEMLQFLSEKLSINQ